MTTPTTPTTWNVNFLREKQDVGAEGQPRNALIILNTPFSSALLRRLWSSTHWRCCADGGANRLFDTLDSQERTKYLPNLIKGDLDSIRPDVRQFYANLGVIIIQDHDQDSTDLMKCVAALEKKEVSERQPQYQIILLGGLTGRLDQTIHTLSYLHKLRKQRDRVFAVTDENIGWVLDSASAYFSVSFRLFAECMDIWQGEHEIEIDHNLLGQTCSLLPVGIDQTMLTTSGLKWNLTDHESSFDGLVSTSNHLVPEEPLVRIKTSKPIWWTAELKGISSTELIVSALTSTVFSKYITLLQRIFKWII